VNFILDNIFLVAVAAISGIALMLPAFRGAGKRASPTEVTQLINRGKTTILDVRDAAEYAAGHLRDAKHIPLGELSSRIAELDKSKSKTVVVVCQRGNRADRAVRTLWLTMDEMDLMWIPVKNDWRLNERHYGALQGLDKAETAAKFGDEQVLVWRRSYDIPPPALEAGDERTSFNDPRYAGVAKEQLPLTECLKDTVARVMPAWEEEIAPAIRSGRKILISAHGNSLRALLKMLDGISDNDIVGLNSPNGQPLVYELDADLKPVRHYYLGDQEAIAAAMAAVANQGKAK